MSPILIIFFLVVIGTAIFVIPKLKDFKTDNRRESIYKTRTSVMNPSESALFFELQKQLLQGYYIFPKIRIADILETKDYYHKRNKILPKHVDFLICDSYFKPIVAIEVNGGYHNSQNQQKKDLEKIEIFKDAGLILETIEVGENFHESIERIKSHFQ
jgi:very-short-patch-repair endonuclease